MSYLLHIETSNPICSVAISENGKLLTENTGKENNNHAAQITILIQSALAKTNIQVKQLSAVAVSSGPGSYTGLRIGVSVAKGICHALNIPLIAVNTLQAMANGVRKIIDNKNALLCPLIDARRMEAYCALYHFDLQPVQQPAAIVFEKNIFADTLENHTIVFFGSGMEKLKHILQHPHSIFPDHFMSSAKNMVELSTAMYQNKDFADLAYFEPNYIKSFYTRPARED